MENKIQELLQQVGRPYQMFNDDGTYQGCFYPVQFLYPDKPRYKLRSLDDDKNYWYGFAKIKEHCVEIPLNEPVQTGDLIVTRFNDELHVAVFWKFGKIIHVFRNHSLQVGRLKLFKEYKVFRVL